MRCASASTWLFHPLSISIQLSKNTLGVKAFVGLINTRSHTCTIPGWSFSWHPLCYDVKGTHCTRGATTLQEGNKIRTLLKTTAPTQYVSISTLTAEINTYLVINNSRDKILKIIWLSKCWCRLLKSCHVVSWYLKSLLMSYNNMQLNRKCIASRVVFKGMLHFIMHTITCILLQAIKHFYLTSQ